ncbi:hypothetical protein SAMN04488134_102131 [Amphibacillus marinus]|uniref:Uncharacterized protein n=1 Tax=Amphibacillus marinus TaxID=872970 RepID=A0A1H8K2D9_9BACI|nr:hypothetical protein [Amphibacillus marinus]SEN86568.1 hypothetical protein SAMN04488134_102131 [Amphibacillus marinus]
MIETIVTLGSVAFGALLGYVFQLISDKRNQKNVVKKEKVEALHNLLKVDRLNGPNNESMHAYHFDVDVFKDKIYPVLLDGYYYFPVKIRSVFDKIYWQIKDVEINDLYGEISSRDFLEKLSNAYKEGIKDTEREVEKLVK